MTFTVKLILNLSVDVSKDLPIEPAASRSLDTPVPSEIVLLFYISGIDEKDNFPEKAEDLYNTPAYNELYETFNAAIAHHAFVPLCGIMGSKYMETALHNHDLIWNLCCSHDVQLSHPTCEDVRASEEEENGEETVDNMGGEGTLEVDSAVSGNRGLDGEADERVRGKKKFGKRPKPPMWRIGRKLSAKTKDVPAANM